MHRVAAGRKGELAEHGVCVLHLRQGVANGLPFRLARALDGPGHDVDRGVGLGSELVRIGAVLGVVGLDEILVAGRIGVDEPGCAGDGALRGRAGQLRQLGRVETVAANEVNAVGNAELSALRHDARRFFGQRRNHDGFGIQGLDLGQLRREVGIALLERFGGQDLDPFGVQGRFEYIIAALGERVVVAVENGHLLVAQAGLCHLDRVGDHGRFGQAVAEDEIANFDDPGRGIGGRQHDDLLLLGHGVCRFGRVGESRPEDGNDFVLVDQLFERGDGAFFGRTVIFGN